MEITIDRWNIIINANADEFFILCEYELVRNGDFLMFFEKYALSF